MNLTSLLLTQGGDERIALLPPDQVNRYGCPPLPDPGLLELGSCTASVISEPAFDAASRLRGRWHGLPSDAQVKDIAQTMMAEFLHLHGLDTLPGILAEPAASGTDALALGAARIHALLEPADVVMVSPEESGREAPTAVQGHARTTLRPIRARDTTGQPLPASTVSGETRKQVALGLSSGRNILLLLSDVTKTGLIVPGIEEVLDLHRHHPDQVSVLVDACQFRLGRDALRGYLEAGFLVALTGSKFMGGPAFSGILLTPPGHATLKSGIPTPAPHPGLLLRWEAALEEMRRFHTLHPAEVFRTIREFGELASNYFHDNHRLSLLPSPAPDRKALFQTVHDTWDNLQTIFPYLVRRTDNQWCSVEDTLQIFRQLPRGSDLRGRLGQPVHCGRQNHQPLSALRLCLGARTFTSPMPTRKIFQLVDRSAGLLRD